MKKSIFCVLFIWTITGFAISMACAQPFGMMGERREEAREKLQTLKKLKLVEALNLSEDQTAKVFPRLNDLEQLNDKFREERRQLLLELEGLVRDRKTSEEQLKARIAAIDEHEKKFHADEEKLRQKVRDALTIDQQARWLIFEERFEEQVRKLIRDARGDRPAEDRPKR